MEGTQYKYLVSFLLVLMALLIGLFIGSFASVTIGTFLCILKGEGVDAFELASNPAAYPNFRAVLLIMQGVYSLFAFLITPYLTVKFLDRFPSPVLNTMPKNLGSSVLLTLVIIFAYFPLSSYLVFINQTIEFPEALKWFETYLQEKERVLQEMTLFMTDFESVSQFILGLIIIAVIPAIGEEYLFRGLMQNRLQLLTKNTHVAVWLSAFIFSAFHMQFYGILPRMVLGGLFGYLYIWSGSMLVPIIAHLFNNGFTLTMIYFYRKGEVPINIEETENVPGYIAVLSLVVVTFLLITFKKKYYPLTENKQNVSPQLIEDNE